VVKILPYIGARSWLGGRLACTGASLVKHVILQDMRSEILSTSMGIFDDKAMLPIDKHGATTYISVRGKFYRSKTPGLPHLGVQELHDIPKLKLCNGFSWAKGTALDNEFGTCPMPVRARAILSYCFLFKASTDGQPLGVAKIDLADLTNASGGEKVCGLYGLRNEVQWVHAVRFEDK
jgi:hypothetical protein